MSFPNTCVGTRLRRSALHCLHMFLWMFCGCFAVLRSTNEMPDKFATISRCCNDGEKKESGGVLMKGVCSGCRVTELPKVPGHATRVFSALFIQPPPLPGIRCIALLIGEREPPANPKLPRRAQLSATYHHHHFLQSIMALAP